MHERLPFWDRIPMGADPELTQDTTMRAPARPEAIQRLLGRDGPALVFGEILGRGSMGIVRAGEQTALGREVAIKSPRTRDLEDMGSLLQEAWVAGALEHPNIVPVYDIQILDDQPHVVMKKLQGTIWSDLVNAPEEVLARFGRSDSLEWNIEVLISVCNAIEYAHDRGILHRDLKPSNVMIGHYGEVWVLDWGIAVSLTEEHAQHLPLAREQQGVAGTPAYMAPEMAEGDGARLSVRTDVYLLGALLYRIIAGEPPHAGNDVEAVYKALFQPIPVDPDWPLAPLLRSALDKDPDQRPPTAAAFRAALQAFLSGRDAQALVHAANQRLEALKAAVHRADSDADRFALYDLFGACRFGYREALAIDDTLATAIRGLREATLRMVQYELDQDDDRAAQLLLDQIEHAPEDMVLAAAQLRKRKAAARARLEALDRDNDPRTAWWARALVMTAIGTVWALTPIGTALVGIPHGYLRELLISGVTFAGTGVLMTVLAPWLVKSRLNRALVVLIAAGPGLAFLLNVGGWLRGIDSQLSGTIELFVYFHCALVATLIAEWRLFVGTLGFAAAYFLSMWWEGTTLFWMNLANVLMVLNALAIWIPDGLRQRAPHDTPMF